MGFGSGSLDIGSACSISLNTVLTPEERVTYQNNDVIRKILSGMKTIAIVGLSTEKTKPSSMVASYLRDEGFTVIPVNPKAAEILGEKSYPDLASIPFPVDVVDIFRPANEVTEIVNEAIRIKAKSVWMQLRIINFPAADTAIAAGLNVVIDKCIKMELGRYSGGLHWAGMNTEIISAKKQKR